MSAAVSFRTHAAPRIRAASEPRSIREHRVMVVDATSGAIEILPAAGAPRSFVDVFERGDLLVLNDAATLPASLRATRWNDAPVDCEVRLVRHVEGRRWTVALFGAGDFRTPTEARAAPPSVAPTDVLHFTDGLFASILRADPRARRLFEVELEVRGDDARWWSAVYRSGRPIQYAHVPAALSLWDVQNVYAARPWAVEMPSAGRLLTADALLELRRRGVETATVTHAAGISSIGDAEADAILPLPERFEVKEATWLAIERAHRRGGRVVAVGTSTVRALEGGARSVTTSRDRQGVTDLKLGPRSRRAIVDAVITGIHDVGTSHRSLLLAFASETLLLEAEERAAHAGLLGHELGDACLVWGSLVNSPMGLRTRDLT